MSGLMSIFKKPKMPDVKNPAVPTRSDADIQAAAEEQRRKLAGGGSGTSWLTGGQGVARNDNNYAGARLLSGTN